jgi:uncharacterized phage protein (TIGR02220 family)
MINNETIFKTIDYLNNRLSKNFQINLANEKLIQNWISQGYGFEDFKVVIDKKIANWVGTKYEQFIRPKTLFGDKFQEYLNEQPKKSNIHKLADSINRVKNHDWKL